MFFIFGMPRSGTTLLAQCLSAHSEIVVPHETDFIIPMAFIFDRISEQQIGRDLIFGLIAHSTYFPSLEEYISLDDVREAVYSSEYSAAGILNAVYTKVAKASGAKIAGDKSPNDLNFFANACKNRRPVTRHKGYSYSQGYTRFDGVS